MTLMMDRVEFDGPTIRLYHGTDAEYDVVDPAFFLVKPDSAANCALGLWLTPDEELAANFGSTVLTFEFPTDGIVAVPLERLTNLYRAGKRDDDGGFDRHAAFAADLRSAGKSLMLVIEMDGRWGTAVGIDTTVARIVDRRPSNGLGAAPSP